MTKTQQPKRAGAMPAARAVQAKAQPLTVKVKIPAQAAPVFLALCELYGVSREALAARGVLHFIMSETAVEHFDALQNALSEKFPDASPKH